MPTPLDALDYIASRNSDEEQSVVNGEGPQPHDLSVQPWLLPWTGNQLRASVIFVLRRKLPEV